MPSLRCLLFLPRLSSFLSELKNSPEFLDFGNSPEKPQNCKKMELFGSTQHSSKQHSTHVPVSTHNAPG